MRKAIVCMLLLKALYTQVPGSDPEHAQGAIERNRLAHRELAHFVWLIRVEEGDAAGWRRRLNATLGANQGSFDVVEASEEEKKKVERGEITLQR